MEAQDDNLVVFAKAIKRRGIRISPFYLTDMNKQASTSMKKEPPCACHVHVAMEKKENITRIPCLGHGEGCPCSDGKTTE